MRDIRTRRAIADAYRHRARALLIGDAETAASWAATIRHLERRLGAIEAPRPMPATADEIVTDQILHWQRRGVCADSAARMLGVRPRGWQPVREAMLRFVDGVRAGRAA